jgi:hypothetical protein
MRHFFVDETGDLTLFDKRGRSMLGRDGVSQCFMVGVAEIRNPPAVGRRLDALRRDLMSDPYFAGATRKKARRDAALTHAIERARLAQACTARCDVVSDRPSGAAGLQVVDYYLWTVQRLFERAEGRFFAGIAKQVEYVWDLDDSRDGAGGVRYDGQGLVLALEKLLPLAPARFEESLEHPA